MTRNTQSNKIRQIISFFISYKTKFSKINNVVYWQFGFDLLVFTILTGMIVTISSFSSLMMPVWTIIRKFTTFPFMIILTLLGWMRFVHFLPDFFCMLFSKIVIFRIRLNDGSRKRINIEMFKPIIKRVTTYSIFQTNLINGYLLIKIILFNPFWISPKFSFKGIGWRRMYFPKTFKRAVLGGFPIWLKSFSTKLTDFGWNINQSITMFLFLLIPIFDSTIVRTIYLWSFGITDKSIITESALYRLHIKDSIHE